VAASCRALATALFSRNPVPRALQLQFATASPIRLGCKILLPHHASRMSSQSMPLPSGCKSLVRRCSHRRASTTPLGFKFMFYNGAGRHRSWSQMNNVLSRCRGVGRTDGRKLRKLAESRELLHHACRLRDGVRMIFRRSLFSTRSREHREGGSAVQEFKIILTHSCQFR